MSEIHPLRRWLFDHQMTGLAFAEKVGVSGAAVSQWVNGVRVPSLDLAIKIEDATGGAVKARDMLAPAQASD
jgi:DNA-binding transcriptional regulator YdaS (Cro superfamily)